MRRPSDMAIYASQLMFFCHCQRDTSALFRDTLLMRLSSHTLANMRSDGKTQDGLISRSNHVYVTLVVLSVSHYAMTQTTSPVYSIRELYDYCVTLVSCISAAQGWCAIWLLGSTTELYYYCAALESCITTVWCWWAASLLGSAGDCISIEQCWRVVSLLCSTGELYHYSVVLVKLKGFHQ